MEKKKAEKPKKSTAKKRVKKTAKKTAKKPSVKRKTTTTKNKEKKKTIKNNITENRIQEKIKQQKHALLLLLFSFTFLAPLGVISYKLTETTKINKKISNKLQEKNRIIDKQRETINKLDAKSENKTCNNVDIRAVGTGCFDVTKNGKLKYKDDIFMGKEDSVLVYKNDEITFAIPYNNSWGNSGCAIRPYVKTKQGILFGRPNKKGGQFAYSTSTYKGMDDLTDELENNEIDYENIKINNIEVISYNKDDTEEQKVYEIVGNEYNHKFYTSKEDAQEIVKVLNSIRMHN